MNCFIIVSKLDFETKLNEFDLDSIQFDKIKQSEVLKYRILPLYIEHNNFLYKQRSCSSTPNAKTNNQFVLQIYFFSMITIVTPFVSRVT